MDINQFAHSIFLNKSHRAARSVFGKNQLLWDLGMNTLLMNKKADILSKIRQLDSEFDLVLIAEKFDQSLILLQNILCWKVSDVTYLKLNERIPKAKSKLRYFQTFDNHNFI